MKRFAQLYAEVDATTGTTEKVAALARYFADAAPADAAWAVYFLAGGKPRQVVPTGVLRSLACELAGLPDWLFDACYQSVGDFAETVAYVLPPPSRRSELSLATWMETRLLPLRGVDPREQSERIAGWWDELDTGERFLLTKLIGGGFRVGVSKLLVQRALAAAAGVDGNLVAQRMMGYTDSRRTPSAERYVALTAADRGEAGQPYPFFLAFALDAPLAEFASRLGPPADWIIEWKYDGIRAQLVKRGGLAWIWSRGEELVTDRYPEVASAMQAVPDGTVLDGELVVWKDDGVAPFQLLQRRIGLKTLTKKTLADAPVAFIAYDILEDGGADVRDEPLAQRRARLEPLVAAHPPLRLSPTEQRPTWPELDTLREEARARGVEGFMLKHRLSRYGVGRRKQDDLAAGTWWKWKIAPLSVDAVLIYAQAGHGRRASLYTDYTFAVWNRTPRDAAEVAMATAVGVRREPLQADALQLVPFAKAYSGLTDAEIVDVDRTIRRTTVEKFGPVRSLQPALVFELGFEGIGRSTRHKSGIAVRFPRMLRIRHDKPLHEADTLATLEALLKLE